MLSLQLIMLYRLAVIGIIYVTAASSLALTARDTGRETGGLRERSRCPFIRNSLVNGRVKIRSRGRIAKFICNNGYELVGRRFATCVRSQWNNPIPICVTNGCPVINNPANGKINIQISDALVTFSCDAGYILRGSDTVYCNGAMWNDTAPVCDISTVAPELTCDFEDPDICGWTHDRYHDFDWRRHQFSTPSGHVGTGPSYDHTLGKNNDGFYMYTEASPPRVINDSARLFSPVYFPETTPACFVFWYHMFGATTGALRVYLKKESQVFKELLPSWEKSGPQGNLWLQGDLSIPESNENFQIVIEGIRGSGYVGDTAIDDVALYSTPCEDLVLANISRGADSCKQRCFLDDDVNSTCSCKQGCGVEFVPCCDDYDYFCADSANRTDVGLFSIEPLSKRMSTPYEQSHLPVETSHAVTVTPGSTFTSSQPPIINTSEEVVSAYLNASSNISNQNITTKSPSLTAATTTLTNGTIPVINSPTSNLSQPLTTVSSAISVNVSVSTNELILNTTTSQKTTVSPTITIVDETTQKKPSITSTPPATTKKIVIPLPSTKTPTFSTTHQTIKPTMLPSKSPTVEKLTTNVASTSILSIKTTGNSISSSTSTTASTVSQSTTSKQVIPPTIITPAPTTKVPLTSQATVPTQSATYSARPSSLVQERKSNAVSSTQSSPSSTISINTSSSIIDEVISTGRYSKIDTTSKQPTRAVSMMPQSSTVSYYRKTRKPIDKVSPVATRTRKTARPTTSPTTVSIFQTKTSLKLLYPKISFPLHSTNSTTPKFLSTASTAPSMGSSAASTSQKLTSVYCPDGSLRFRNGRCFPPWTNNRPTYSSQAVVSTRTTNMLQTSSLVNKTSSTPLEVTNVSNRNVTLKLPTLKTNQQPLPSPSESFTDSTNPTAYDSTEYMLSNWKPDFKSRTKYRTYLQNSSEKSPVPITMIVALTVGSILALVLIIIVTMYVSSRKRKVAQSKLSDDSEMRFLSDSEIVEFADPSSKLHADSG